MPPVRTNITSKDRRGYFDILPEENIIGRKLPSQRQVLSVFMHHHLVLGEDISVSANYVAAKVEEYWDMAYIPHQKRRDIVPKIKTLWTMYLNLKKSSLRRTETQVRNETAFQDKIQNHIFDIATKKVDTEIKIEEDRKFLAMQRQRGRPGYMERLDKTLVEQMERADKRKSQELRRAVLSRQEMHSLEERATLESSGTDTSAAEATDSDSSDFEINSKERRKKKSKSTLDPDLVMALDRTGVSSRHATHILKAVYKNPENKGVALSATTVRRQRDRIRVNTPNMLKVDVKAQFTGPITLHWDGKHLPDTGGDPG